LRAHRHRVASHCGGSGPSRGAAGEIQGTKGAGRGSGCRRSNKVAAGAGGISGEDDSGAVGRSRRNLTVGYGIGAIAGAAGTIDCGYQVGEAGSLARSDHLIRRLVLLSAVTKV